jgi:glycosyltransferase involved in cell wall biosynthesis
LDPRREWIQYSGEIPFKRLHEIYQEAELFVFGSSCENMPNILLEAMAAGLPIASSNRGPMPEMLGEAGLYFDPEDPASIASSIWDLIESPELRTKLAKAAFERAKGYSWRRCADETFELLAQVANRRN